MTAATQPVLPEEIVEEIFLRLDDADDLARAACACPSFCRVVSARNFVRRFRSLHPLPVVGVLELHGPGAFHPAGPPHRSAPAARALAQAADFTFSFLPKPDNWQVCDALGDLVLLMRLVSPEYEFVELVVCDPLHRRYVLIPPIPDNLAATAGGWGMPGMDSFFDPAGKDHKEENEEENLSFRLISGVYGEEKLVTFHFSSATGEWCACAQVFPLPTPLDPSLVISPGLFEHHCAHGCFFWTISIINISFLMLDMREMKLSLVDLPPVGTESHELWAIVDAREGVLDVLVLGHGVLNLYCKALRSNGVDPEEWKHEKIIPLPELYSAWRIFSTAEGYALLQATPQRSSQSADESQYFTLDLRTLLVERLCMSTQDIGGFGAHLYASFPPLLSLPSL